VTVTEELRDLNIKGSHISTLNVGRNEFRIKTTLFDMTGQWEGQNTVL